jgi:rubrerythrin
MTARDIQTPQALPGAVTAGGDPAELVCRVCGHGVLAAALPPPCPMCHASSWRIGEARAAQDDGLELH